MQSKRWVHGLVALLTTAVGAWATKLRLRDPTGVAPHVTRGTYHLLTIEDLMDKPEPLLLLSTWGQLAIPMSRAQDILPHLITLRSNHKDGVTTYSLKDEAMKLEFVDLNAVIAMLVAAKLDNKE